MKISAMMMNGRTNNTKSNMNKNVVLVFTTMALLLSCSREVDQVIQPGETITFTAGWAGAKDTRTILQPDGTSVWWEPSAQINVFFSNKASGKFTSTNSQAQGIVDFKGSLPIIVGSVETDNPAHAYWAVYPYDSANTCDGESVTLTIPSTQTASEGTFANKMFPSIATSTNFYLAFYNICGGVRFTVANEGISSVTFKANNGESLVGKVQVGFDGVPVIKNVTAGSTEVTVNAPEGGFIPGREYFASILPQTLSKGVSLTFKKSNGTVASTSIDNAITVNRSRFGTMTEKDKSLVFQGEVPVSSIELSQTSVQLRVGESVTLIATVKPDDATDKTVKWTSLNEKVAKVDANGVVTALLEGNVLITASSGDKTATCSVTVVSANFHPNGEYLAFTGLNDESSISYETSHRRIEYSYDTQTWYSWDSSLTITLSTGIKLYVRGKDWYRIRFKMTGKISASGNIMSLLYYDDFANRYSFESGDNIKGLFQGCASLVEAPDFPATVLSPNCYESLFQDCINLNKAPELPATTLANNCYASMFKGCESLTEAPVLPATTLADSCYEEMFSNCYNLTNAPDLPATNLASYCYKRMFLGCESLTEAPVLPATTLALGCYEVMFGGCKNLTDAPAVLPATTLAYSCYFGMFYDCDNLTEAPELPATTLAGSCYYGMFSNCDNLTEAPILPATTLAEGCYAYMFDGCDNLTEAPALPATTLANGCYSHMFVFCKNLTDAPEALPATTLADHCYAEMFSDCDNLTNAPYLPAMTLASNCCYRMYYGCKNLTDAPAVLPATTLADHCYEEMFIGCESLTEAPDLPATTLAEGCYKGMFEGCSNLTRVPQLLASTLVSDCYYYMFCGCFKVNYIKMLAINIPNKSFIAGFLSGAETGTFVKHASASWTNDGIVPSGWTVITATE